MLCYKTTSICITYVIWVSATGSGSGEGANRAMFLSYGLGGSLLKAGPDPGFEFGGDQVERVPPPGEGVSHPLSIKMRILVRSPAHLECLFLQRNIRPGPDLQYNACPL